MRELADLSGIGPAMLKDFRLLEIDSVERLAAQNAHDLYERLCDITRSRQDPCVLDVFTCAIAQARNPRLPMEKRNWWYWSRIRKAELRKADDRRPPRQRNRSR